MSESLISVGIDVGTSTTQLVFSRIKVENTASAWTIPTVKIIDKMVIYKSDIHFTPLKSQTVIDAAALKDIVSLEYKKAQMNHDSVDTGAIIITGETARKENAKEVLEMLSGFAGDFVVATAGPDLEGILAGKGSGAAAYSKAHNNTVINFDIGGGTTNVAVFQNGKVVDTACFDIGGRLIKIGSDKKVTYLSKKAQALIKLLNLPIEVGSVASIENLEIFVDAMAKTIIDIVNGEKADDRYTLLITDHDLMVKHKNHAVFLSGGVADCLEANGSDAFVYGDIGILLGQAIFRAMHRANAPLVKGGETIRATVVGAGNHTTDISGSTIHVHGSELPIKNIPIAHLTKEEEGLTGDGRVAVIKNKISWLVGQSDMSLVALGLKGKHNYGFDDIESLAYDIVKGMKQMLESGQPLIVLIEGDFAKSLGLCMKRFLTDDASVICIDSIYVDNGDYIDIGVPIANGQVVPVVIKTLLFGY